jgi:hypothetical protein
MITGHVSTMAIILSEEAQNQSLTAHDPPVDDTKKFKHPL